MEQQQQEQQFIGQQVATWRRRRGMSQRVLAGQAGISQPYLSQIETGGKPVERRSTLVGLANALQVSVAELTGQRDDPTDPAKARAAAAVPAIRTAIIMRESGESVAPDAGTSVDAAMAASTATDYTTLAPTLPNLIGSRTGPDLVRVGYVAMWYLQHVGHIDLARAVARLALDEAREADTPAWLGAAEYAREAALPQENADVAARLATRAADGIQHALSDPDVRQMYGMLHLRAALRTAAMGDGAAARSHLSEAAMEADTLGEPSDGKGMCSLAFGPTTVGLWHLKVNVELGEPDAAISAAETVDPRLTVLPHRRAFYWLDLGRALATAGRDDDAALALLRAETVCPQLARLHYVVRDTVGVMLRRTQRRAVSGPLRRAAQMIGVEA
jgi:transcriptional regulator with XRE-family HTH domain